MRDAFLCMTSGPPAPQSGRVAQFPAHGRSCCDRSGQRPVRTHRHPSVLLVADALNLAQHADGMVVAARMKETRIEEAREVRTILERSGGRAYGLVVMGSTKNAGRTTGVDTRATTSRPSPPEPTRPPAR